MKNSGDLFQFTLLMEDVRPCEFLIHVVAFTLFIKSKCKKGEFD